MKDSMFNNPIKAVGLPKYQERQCFVAVKNSFVKYIQGSCNKLCVITTPREILRLYFLFLNDVHASMNLLLMSLARVLTGRSLLRYFYIYPLVRVSARVEFKQSSDKSRSSHKEFVCQSTEPINPNII